MLTARGDTNAERQPALYWFLRTQTLCQDSELLCDFRFVRHQNDAGDGWERLQTWAAAAGATPGSC